MRSLHTIDATGNRLTGTIPDEMMGMNPNIRLNFTDNLCVGFICACIDVAVAHIVWLMVVIYCRPTSSREQMHFI